MNIIDAVKSGKRFKRKKDFIWCDAIKHPEWFLDPEDILATDWEIEEKKIEITESELDEAFLNAVCTVKAEAMLESFKKRLFGK